MRQLGMATLLIFLVACGARSAVPPTPVPTPVPMPIPTEALVQIVTIAGLDEQGNDISPINVWDNYQTRGKVVTKVSTGDQVTLIERQGNGVLIETSGGVRGWVTFSFIRELR